MLTEPTIEKLHTLRLGAMAAAWIAGQASRSTSRPFFATRRPTKPTTGGTDCSGLSSCCGSLPSTEQSSCQAIVTEGVAAQQGETHGLSNAPGVLLRFDPAHLPDGSVLSSDRVFNPVHNLLAQNNF